MKGIFKGLLIVFGVSVALLYSCASIGHPDGGAYDETPPRFLSGTPERGAVGVKGDKITLRFDEFIKLQNAAEKVVVSPPQIEQPELKASGKSIVVQLVDTLKPNTTYTIDFSDAIVDNNEGNPFGDFSYSFSTGEKIDSLEVSGTVLEAETLEPIKGMLVGLHSNLNDTAFHTIPYERVSRTDASGRFYIRGIAPGTYRVFALADANQNFIFDQKNEMIAFGDSLIVPYSRPDIRHDTIWVDSLTIDTVMVSDYTHYYPDNLILLAFSEKVSRKYLTKSDRSEHHKFTLYFSDKNDSLPLLKGLNFDEKDAFVIENSLTNDTVIYWMRDTALYYRDTLEVSVTYMATVDTLDYLVERTDTLRLVPKKSRAKIVEEEKKAFEEAEKAFRKESRRKKRKEEDADKSAEEKEEQYVPPIKFLNAKFKPTGVLDLNVNPVLSFDEPLLSYDDKAVHLFQKVDTVWNEILYEFVPIEHSINSFRLRAEWRPGMSYKVEIDSAAFKGLYGLHTNKIKQEFKFHSLDDYATVFFNIAGVPDSSIVELMDAQGKVKRREFLSDGSVAFYFLLPSKYFFRVIADENRNGKWDTGSYDEKRQPEKVYYYPRALEVRALWDYNQEDWNINMPLNKQKPLEITKQKAETKKEKQSKNEKRNQEKGR